MYRFSTAFPGTSSTGDDMLLKCCDVCSRPGGVPTDSGTLVCHGCKLFVKYYELIELSCPTGLQNCPLDYTKSMCNYCRMNKCRQLKVVVPQKSVQVQRVVVPGGTVQVQRVVPRMEPRPDRRRSINRPERMVVEKKPFEPRPSREILTRDANGIYCQICWVSMTKIVTRYGVLACQDCAEFFRTNRDMFFVKPCENNEQCRKVKETNWTLACESCRMWKCINAGMSIAHEPEVLIKRGTQPKFRPRPVELSNANDDEQCEPVENPPFVRYPLGPCTSDPQPPRLQPYYQEEDSGVFGTHGAAPEHRAQMKLQDNEELTEQKRDPEHPDEDLQNPKEEVDYCSFGGALETAPKEEQDYCSYEKTAPSDSVSQELIEPKPEPEVHQQKGGLKGAGLAEPKREIVDDGYLGAQEPEPKRARMKTPEIDPEDPAFHEALKKQVIRVSPHPERLPPNKLSIIPAKTLAFNAWNPPRREIRLTNNSQKTMMFKVGSTSPRIKFDNKTFGVLHAKETVCLGVVYDPSEMKIDGEKNERIFVEYMNAPFSKPLCEERFLEEGMRYRTVIRVEVEE